MRIRRVSLLEEFTVPMPVGDKLDDESISAAIKAIPEYDKIKGAEKVIAEIIAQQGFDSELLQIMSQMPDSIILRHDKYWEYLLALMNSGKLVIFEDGQLMSNLQLLHNESLWDRNYSDFEYTVNALQIFNSVRNRRALDIDEKDVESVFFNIFFDNGRIRSRAEIYNAIEEYENPAEELQTLKQVLTDNGADDTKLAVLATWMEDNFQRHASAEAKYTKKFYKDMLMSLAKAYASKDTRNRKDQQRKKFMKYLLDTRLFHSTEPEKVVIDLVKEIEKGIESQKLPY